MARSSASEGCGRYVAESWYRSATATTSGSPFDLDHVAIAVVTSSGMPHRRISSPSNDAAEEAASDRAGLDMTGSAVAETIGGGAGTVANEIHHARRAAAAAVNARYSCPRERHAAGKPGCAQSMLDVAECLISRERLELAANADALVQLPQLAAPQAVRELRLAGEHDLEQFAARCLEV